MYGFIYKLRDDNLLSNYGIDFKPNLILTLLYSMFRNYLYQLINLKNSDLGSFQLFGFRVELI